MKFFQTKQSKETRDKIHAAMLVFCQNFTKNQASSFSKFVANLKKDLEHDEQWGIVT